MRVAIYARVSSDSQTTENQIRDLNEVGRRLGWAVVETFTDHGISGAKGRDRRPAFDSLMQAVTRRDIDLVAAWSVDRLSRSLVDLIGFMEELRNRDIGLFLHQQNLDTTTPAGRAMFGMLGIFAEFERATIRSRVVAGIERARAQGKRLGRPPIKPYRVRDIQTHLADGMSIRETATIVGCSVGTVHRVKNALRKEHE